MDSRGCGILALIIAAHVFASACDVVPFDHVRVTRSAVLYETAELCHSSRVAVASDVRPPGMTGIVEAGEVLKVTQQSLSKETLCLRVKYKERDAFLVASKETSEWVKP